MNNKQLLNELLCEFRVISGKIEKLLDYIADNYNKLDKTTLSLLETQGCYMMKYRDILLLRMNTIKYGNESGDSNENIK